MQNVLEDRPTKTAARFVLSSIVAFATFAAGGVPLGCSDDGGSGTTGRRISLESRIEASAGSRRFTNAKGWTVDVTKALVSTGAHYLYDGETLFAARTSPPRLRGFFATAFAHPGHYVPGNAKGEILSASSADLLAGGALGAGSGVTGTVRSASFSFAAPAVGSFASELGQNVIVLEGAAALGSSSRLFRAEILAAEVADAKGRPEIEGCPVATVDMASDGVVTIAVRVDLWLDQVDFTDVPESADGKPVVLSDGLARNQLVRGTKAALAYAFSYAPR